MTSYRYFPSTGGIQTVSRLLARGFVEHGHEVRIITSTTDQSTHVDDCKVYRTPNPRQLINLHRWADVVFHNNITLTWAWPLLLVRKPLVSALHIAISRGHNDPYGILAAGKLQIIKRIPVIAPSEFLAKSQPFPVTVVPNAYDESIYTPNSPLNGKDHSRVAFVGRIVPGKGLDILLKALTDCRDRGTNFELEVIGEGPSRADIETMAANLGLGDQVRFHGALTPIEIAPILRECNYHVVPSTVEETFGVVALEGIASGCQVICSDIGGLPEAVGDVGWCVDAGSHSSLSDALLGLACGSINPHPPESLQRHADKFTSTRMIEGYLRVLTEATSPNL